MVSRHLTRQYSCQGCILHVVQSLKGGGAETIVRNLVPRLQKRGFDIRVLCAYGSSGLSEVEDRQWTAPLYCVQRSGVPRLSYLYSVYRIVRVLRPVLLHTHTHVGSIWGRTAGLLAGVPVIIHSEHGQDMTESSPFERIFCAGLDARTSANIALSETYAKEMRKHFHGRQIVVIPNGVEPNTQPSLTMRQLSRCLLKLPIEVVVIGFVANLYPHKDPLLAIDAYALLPVEIRKNARLAIFGEGPLRSMLEKRVAQAGLEPYVKLYGFQPDIEKLLPGLDTILSTSAHEMMPMSFLEAMNAALPIVSVPHAAAREIITHGETGMIAKSWRAEDIAAALAFVITHPDWRREAGQAAWRRVQDNFNIEKVADRYAQLYRSFLGCQPSCPAHRPSAV
jgi:glycosyltransferase involved in cell wall biosynthesis